VSEVVARRYARAIFELGREKNQLAPFGQQLAAFAEAFEQSADFREMGDNPLLGDEARDKVVEQLGQRFGASKDIVQFVRLLVRRGRLIVLPDVVRQFGEMVDEHNGVLRATVRSASKLSTVYLDKLKGRIEKATGKQVVIQFEQDPALIAGVLTQIGDRVIDGTVRGKLDGLASSIHQT
jgi:F-type H+-transporting ATPase subunit delta